MELNSQNQFHVSAISEKYIDLVREIVLRNIDKKLYMVFLFGSRVQEKHSRAADVDVGILGKKVLPPSVLRTIRDELEESNVPYAVDIVDFIDADEDFRQAAMQDIYLWNRPKSFDKKLK